MKPDDGWLEQYAAAWEGSPQLVWASADGGRWTWSNPSWTAYTGLSAAASWDLGWYHAVHPDDRALVQEAWRAAPMRGVLDVQHRLLDRDGGEARWFRTLGTPLPTQPGQPRQWAGTCTDVQQTRWLEERERRLKAALQRFIRDGSALKRLVYRRTFKTSATLEDCASHLEGRLDALARAESLVAESLDTGVDIERLMMDEALAHAAVPGEQIRIDGPTLLLAPKATLLVGLTLHELMANAVKFGALSVPEGWVDVLWHVEGAWSGQGLRFEWREGGMPPVQRPPGRRGFGTELIERVLERELGASASLGIGHDGAHCTILLPLIPGIVVPDARGRAPWW